MQDCAGVGDRLDAGLVVAAAIFFIVVKPMNALQARRARGEEPAPAAPTELELLAEIRDELRRRRA